METIKNIKLPDGNTYKIGGGLDDKITNCITEIPQDIKLELNEGVLTLKAGSKVYVPYGFEADGTTPKFDEVVIGKDISTQALYSRQDMLCYSQPIDSINYVTSSWTYSGATAPTGQTYMFWYDTANNLVKYTDNGGSTWVSGRSLPLALFTSNSTQITSIDQTFNGFGYIGSTVFVTKGVKGLIPNGRNEDGTLNNIEFETSKVITHNIANTVNLNGNGRFLLANNDVIWARIGSYDEKNNYVLGGNGVEKLLACVFADNCTVESGVIKIFNPKLPFRAVDYNDLTSIVPTGTVISSASSATPTGYLYCNGAAVSRTTYADLFSAIGTTYGTGDGSTTFNLPNYTGYRFVTNTTVSVKGTGMGLGLTNGSQYTGLTNSSGTLRSVDTAYGKNVGTKYPGSTNMDTQVLGITTDASKSGITGTVSTATIKWYIKY